MQKINTHNKFIAVDIRCIIDGLITVPGHKIDWVLNFPHSTHSFQFNNRGLLTIITRY